jgi:hypothetical protein
LPLTSSPSLVVPAIGAIRGGPSHAPALVVNHGAKMVN